MVFVYHEPVLAKFIVVHCLACVQFSCDTVTVGELLTKPPAVFRVPFSVCDL
jgi:hypothetical protein